MSSLYICPKSNGNNNNKALCSFHPIDSAGCSLGRLFAAVMTSKLEAWVNKLMTATTSGCHLVQWASTRVFDISSFKVVSIKFSEILTQIFPSYSRSCCPVVIIFIIIIIVAVIITSASSSSSHWWSNRINVRHRICGPLSWVPRSGYEIPLVCTLRLILENICPLN